MEKAVPRLSTKSTKEEMLRAYNDLVARFQEKQESASERQTEVKRLTEASVVERASKYTVETIIKGLADLNIYVGKALNDLSRELTTEADKLSEIRDAIAIETKSLEERYDIHLAADTLAGLIKDHQEKKAAFETERAEAEQEFNFQMAEKRFEWKKEQEAYAGALRDNETRVKKEREREREEYEYNLTLARKKDIDAYEAQKAALLKTMEDERSKQEREFKDRETAVKTQEVEIAELRAKVSGFPPELTAAVERAEKEAASGAETRARQEAQLLAKEIEGDKRVAQLKIAALEEAVAKQVAQIEALTKKLDEANAKVEEIAVKAIEGASNARALTTINEIAMEQAKNLSGKR
jgi:hypothetical protein